MKRLSKLVLGIAAGVLAMGMTVSAANSVTAENRSETAAQTTSVEKVVSATGVTTVGTTSTAKDDDIHSGYYVANTADTFAKVTGGAEMEAVVMDVVDLTVTATKDGKALTAEEIKAGVEVAIACPAVKAGENYVVLHRKADGNWESVPVVSIVDGKIVAKFTSFSPVMIVKVKGDVATAPAGTSPKTGATAPVAGVMAMICLMGAAVFYKKARA